MYDLDTLHLMNDRAYEEYHRKKAITTLEVLREKLHNTRPPSISLLLNVFQNAETYNEFVVLVREYLPEREREILAKTSPHEQMACFASHFEERYLPLHPSFKEGECEDDYREILRNIPVTVMGFGWEDYHELNDHRLGIQLMSFLFEPPFAEDSDQQGERVALADGFPPAYRAEAQRVPTGGITLTAAERILKGKKWLPLQHWAAYINMSTGNWFLDMDNEMFYSGGEMNGWDKDVVEEMKKLWFQAQAYYDKMMNFALWLEGEKEGPAHFKQTVDFILANLQAGDVRGGVKDG
ncbi:MAG: hypothetical protein Q8O55_01635 [Dehalococcoidales bacterium]|nr:hypothetical protein [Dehalococcoidales bacterium]